MQDHGPTDLQAVVTLYYRASVQALEKESLLLSTILVLRRRFEMSIEA